MKYYLKHIAIALAIFFVLYSYINADLYWMKGMFTEWSRADRFGFLYALICASALGCLVGYARKGPPNEKL